VNDNWELRTSVVHLCRRVLKSQEYVDRANLAMPKTSGGSGLTPFIADVRHAYEALDQEIVDLLAFARKQK
jgi:hypothetical protein